MNASRVTAIVAFVLWGGMALMGLDAMSDISAQRVAGFPNSEQRTYYLYFPLTMAVVALLILAAAWRSKHHVGCFAGLLIAALPPYLFFYGGGI